MPWLAFVFNCELFRRAKANLTCGNGHSAEVGALGWMADFGEYLPFDAQLYAGSAAEVHNDYPRLWAELNQQAVQQAGMDWTGQRQDAFGTRLLWNWEVDLNHYPGWGGFVTSLQKEGIRMMTYINPHVTTNATSFHPYLHRDLFEEGRHNGYLVKNVDGDPYIQASASPAFQFGTEGDAVYFMRSSFVGAPKATTVNWLGDQLVTWDSFDGLQSAVIGALSSGLSGISMTHSDIGGFTNMNLSHTMVYLRSKELLLRWCEMSAFSDVVFRTHLGNLPTSAAQIYSDDATLRHFARFARVHQALGHFRQQLMTEAQSTGAPLVRPLFLHFPQAFESNASNSQFLVGKELLVAPVLRPGVLTQQVWLPPGEWEHLWTCKTELARESRWVQVDAHIGSPPVFFWKAGNFSLCVENIGGGADKLRALPTSSSAGRTSPGAYNRLRLRFASADSEKFYGFGVQYTYLDLKGQVVPVLVTEQGVGRGLRPITKYLNSAEHGAGGSPLTTYAPMPYYVTSFNRGLLLHSSRYSVFDLSRTNAVQVSADMGVASCYVKKFSRLGVLSLYGRW
eukprot:gene20636-24738_t